MEQQEEKSQSGSVEMEPAVQVERPRPQYIPPPPVVRNFAVLLEEFQDRFLEPTVYYDKYVSLLRSFLLTNQNQEFTHDQLEILRSDLNVTSLLPGLLRSLERVFLSRDLTIPQRLNILKIIDVINSNPHCALQENPEQIFELLLKCLLSGTGLQDEDHSTYLKIVSLVVKKFMGNMNQFNPSFADIVSGCMMKYLPRLPERCMVPILTAFMICGREEDIVSEMANLMQHIETLRDECINEKIDCSELCQAQGMVEQCVRICVERSRASFAEEAHSLFPYMFLSEIYGHRLYAMMRPLPHHSMRYGTRAVTRGTLSSEHTSSGTSDSLDGNKPTENPEPVVKPPAPVRKRRTRELCLSPSVLAQGGPGLGRSYKLARGTKSLPIHLITDKSREQIETCCDIFTTF